MRSWAAAALCLLLGLAAARPGCAARVPVRASLMTGEGFFLEFDPDARVLFYPQVHYEEDATASDLAEVLDSQFALAAFISEHRQYAVFVEASYDYPQELREAADEKAVPDIFPGGAFPPFLDELDSLQITYLTEKGAPMTLYKLGILPEIHAAMPPAEARRLDNAILAHMRRTGQVFETLDATGMDLVLRQRDVAVAKQVKAYLAAHPDRKALIVFGGAHDFSPYFAGLAYGRVERVAPAGESKEVAHGAGAVPAHVPPPGPGIVDALQPNHLTRLMNAVAGRNLKAVETLLGLHADIHFRDHMGYNALILAALDNDPAMVKLLLGRLTPADVRLPVTLVEGDLVKTHEDVIALLEEKSLETGKDFSEVIGLLKAFVKGPGTPRKTGPATPPGFMGDLSRFLPPWL